VGYPILDLAQYELTIPAYLQKLEQSLIDYLSDLGIDSEPGERGLTGVWSRGEKVACDRHQAEPSIVSHGFALNLTTDLGYFDGIVPCGHADKRPTSVEALTAGDWTRKPRANDYAGHFASTFGVRAEWGAPESMITAGPTR